MSHTTDKQAHMEGLSRFACAVTGQKIVAICGDDTQALMLFGVFVCPCGKPTEKGTHL